MVSYQSIVHVHQYKLNYMFFKQFIFLCNENYLTLLRVTNRKKYGYQT